MKGTTKIVSKNTGPWGQNGSGPGGQIFKEKSSIVDMIIDYRYNHILFQERGLKESRLSEKGKTTRWYTGSFAASKMTRAYNIHGGYQGA